MLSMKRTILLFILTLLPLAGYAVEELQLNAPYKPRAPLEPEPNTRGKGSRAAVEDRELNSEFRGLIHMGLRKYPSDRWPGKEMSDCRPIQSHGGCPVCELQMGHADADYYFYPEDGACTLQQVDAHFPTSDPDTFVVLKRTAQMLFGSSPRRMDKPNSSDVGWDGAGPGWRWESDGDLGYLYNDREQASSDGLGKIRFQWRRPPLSHSNR
jgi:hypothetical protein